jgi:hypothetical protein
MAAGWKETDWKNVHGSWKDADCGWKATDRSWKNSRGGWKSANAGWNATPLCWKSPARRWKAPDACWSPSFRGWQADSPHFSILDLAEPLTTGSPAPGEKHGITTAAVAAVDDLWERYSASVGAPTGARAKRKASTDALPGKFAAVEEKFAELDDYILQFGTTVLGRAFVDAWFNARQVVALGRRAAKPKQPSTPAPKP